MAQKMAVALLAHEKNGDDRQPMDGWDFAGLLTQQLQEVSHDKHLAVGYTPVATPARPESPTPEDMARYRSDMARSNCLIESTKMLPHNVGYLKINGFPDPAICAPRVAAAMQTLNGASAIIYDLRDNHGGDPHMVAVVATYLFARRTHLNDIYTPRSNRTDQFWTISPTPAGNRLSNKPAYVLTSPRTFSGGEEFCYDLKTLKRATLIGERTGGGAHPAQMKWIDDNFNIRVPFARPINPITKTDWEGTGVEPDVRIKTDDALAVAERMALRRRSGK
jgi:C-terminal processing protease CtpA/Prc